MRDAITCPVVSADMNSVGFVWKIGVFIVIALAAIFNVTDLWSP
jgi:hypothetical protein